ncbi:MAG: T9SS type A sorting domain-containing protein, partial [Saprospiraceae bacterium]|nr:T9SS type A sorting domain-containing protein [Saprospiraceae bacterium]
ADARGNLQGIYRSGDGGDNWSSKSLVNINNVPFTWWFGRIYVHPNNPDKVFVTGLNMFASDDGGDSWQRIFYDAHIDHHAFYTHPAVPDFYIDGHDGGIDISYDGGLTHYNVKALENIQFYTCTAEPSNPDVIYGGTQDNGILSTRGEADQWNYLWGGDGFSVLVDPHDNNRIMVQVARGHVAVSSDGGLSFEDRVSGLEGFFNWNAPLVPDPANPDRIYTASQSLYVTENWGVEWSALSPQILQPNVGEGGVVTGTFSALDISSVDEQSICLGTDHGKVWLSRDGGSSFMDITHNLPQRWVTSVKFDKWSTGIYVTLSGFRFGEMTSHVFYSDNEGINWLPVAEELPDIPVNDILVDDLLEDHLYVATDVGVFYSPDRGQSWNKIGIDMPVVPVCDLDKTKESRLLYAATYGKGIYRYELPMTTSLDILTEASPYIYPNPTSGVVYLPDHNKFNSIIVYDMQGLRKASFASSPILNLAQLNQGVYILQLSDKETVVNQKIMIYH